MRDDDDDGDEGYLNDNDDHNNLDNNKIMMEDSSSSLEMVNMKLDDICNNPSRNHKYHIHYNHYRCRYRNDR